MEAVQRLVRSLKSARSYELPEDPNTAYYMLLTYVMQNQHRTFIDLLGTSNTFDVNFVSGKGKRTLLHMAANVGAYECLCHLLKKGAVPNVSDRQGITPLQVAARNGYMRCIIKLLECDADLQIKNNEGMTAIHWLAANGRAEVFAEITKYITNIDVEDDNYQTPLHVACLNGHKSTVIKLLELDASIEKESAHGCTPLYFAAAHGHAEVVQELIQRYATIRSTNDGESPIDVALKGGHGKVCYLLAMKFPNVLGDILQKCLSHDLEVPKVLLVLSFLMSQDVSYRNLILRLYAGSLVDKGLKLLSPSSDYQESSRLFLKNMNLFNHVMSFKRKLNESGSTIELVRTRTNSSTSRNTQSFDRHKDYVCPPSNLSEIETTLDSLWMSMSSWMSILQSEMKSVPKTPNTDEESPSSSLAASASANEAFESDTCNIHSFASHLKRSSTFKRQYSKHSASIERLRLSQPAFEMTLEINENNRKKETVSNSAREMFVRSDSYHNAMALTSDDFERALSPSGDSVGNEQELTFRESLSSVEDITRTESTTEDENFKKSILPSNSENIEATHKGEDTADSQVIELTADRLCAIIQGYHMYCQAVPAWEKSCRNKAVFNSFVRNNEEVLQLLVSRKTQLLFEQFSFLLDDALLFQRFLPAIHAQPFSDRQKWFYERLYDDKKRNSAIIDEQSVINVTRDLLLQTSCQGLTEKNQDHLKRNVTVRFHGEDGMGAGVTREWLDLLVKEMLNPDFALFTLSTDGSTFQPNCNSSINPDHLSYFQFAGRIMGIALYHKHLITAYFTRSFYKHILGVPVSYRDVESIDPEYSKNLQWILDNPIDELGLDITFSVETDVFGQTQEVKLKEDGNNILVTDENKFEYVNRAADLRMTKAIKPQIVAFLKGFNEYIPHSLVSLFNEYELELLLSGIPDIDVDDWMKNTSYQAGFTENDETIQSFWNVVKEFTREEQVQLLQFVTGTSRVPWGGFSNLSGATGSQLFTICRVDGKTNLLPTTSTCFNMLKLPDYESEKELERKLRIAISCGSLGFEFT